MKEEPASVSEETEEALREQLDGEAAEDIVVHLERALENAEDPEARFEIRQALQRILT